ncbi:hypothetical protein LJB93_03475 [Desulfovibrio sp. OttesenSCG-928-F07]|nr:hypothetical protein [Desulfovibrio sp. OttesenSCG-928-F07]
MSNNSSNSNSPHPPGVNSAKSGNEPCRPALIAAQNISGKKVSEQEFETYALRYLNREIKDAEFVSFCELALFDANPTFCATIYKYMYLAYMAQQDYYKALEAAQALYNLEDFETAYSAFITISMRRNNCANACFYMNKLLTHCTTLGLEHSDYKDQAAQLNAFANAVKHFEAEAFCREFLVLPKQNVQNFSRILVQITGYGNFVMDYKNELPCIVLNVDVGPRRNKIVCQLKNNEIPFVTHLKTSSLISVAGYVLSASDKTVVLNPANLVLPVGTL